MAFGKQLFLTNNQANADNITASSQGSGSVSGAKKTGTGTATLTPSGAYTGASSVLVTVQCDGAGTVGSGATYRWKTSSTAAGTWEASAQSATTTLTSLGSEGIQIQFSSGTLVLNDKFQFWAYATYGPGNLFVNDRDKFWKGSTTTSINLVIDLGSAVNFTAIVIADHNLTASATVTIEANASDSWGAPSYTNTLTPIADPLVDYPNETYRYVRIVIADATNTDGFISIGKLYVGTYTEAYASTSLNRANFGTGRTRNRIEIRNVSDAGKARARVLSDHESFPLTYTMLSQTELATLRTVWDATFDSDTGTKTSIWLHYWADVDSTMFLCESVNDFSPVYQRGGSNLTLEWREEVMTRVI